MRAVFKFNGEEMIIDVPLWLYHLSQLSQKLAKIINDNDVDSDDEEEAEAYDFITTECARILAENLNLDMDTLFVEFYQPQTEIEKEFGTVISITN